MPLNTSVSGGRDRRGQQAAAVDPTDHFAGVRVDAHDPVGLPDVGIDLALDPFQFVEFGQRAAVVGDGDAAGFLQCFGIPETHFGGAVAHDDALAVGGQAPAFAGVGEFAFRVEGRQVVDEALLRLPGQFHQAVFPVHDAFAEILARDVALLQHFAGFQLHLADGGLLLQAGAFVEEAVQVEESLGERHGVVRVGVHHL